jgi:hypothetical protein
MKTLIKFTLLRVLIVCCKAGFIQAAPPVESIALDALSRELPWASGPNVSLRRLDDWDKFGFVVWLAWLNDRMDPVQTFYIVKDNKNVCRVFYDFKCSSPSADFARMPQAQVDRVFNQKIREFSDMFVAQDIHVTKNQIFSYLDALQQMVLLVAPDQPLLGDDTQALASINLRRDSGGGGYIIRLERSLQNYSRSSLILHVSSNGAVVIE